MILNILFGMFLVLGSIKIIVDIILTFKTYYSIEKVQAEMNYGIEYNDMPEPVKLNYYDTVQQAVKPIEFEDSNYSESVEIITDLAEKKLEERARYGGTL